MPDSCRERSASNRRTPESTFVSLSYAQPLQSSLRDAPLLPPTTSQTRQPCRNRLWVSAGSKCEFLRILKSSETPLNQSHLPLVLLSARPAKHFPREPAWDLSRSRSNLVCRDA